MREKTRKIFIMIVMAALIVSLMAASFAALTYGRYAGGRRDENSPYEDYIDFVGATAYEVKTPEQFVNAINSGYSYIKIAADAEKPFVVNNDIANVYTNLVIDVNGNTVIRNSRNPVLDVRRNISVVLVYDSSVGAEGGFYNPVGSALQTSGGTLTVGEGVYESGPRTGIGLVSDTVSATVCSRDGRKAASYSVQETNQTFPKLTEKTGDVYLDENYSGTGEYLKPDTYLIYTEEKNAFVGKAGDTVGGTVLQNEQLYVNRKETSSGGTTTITADKFSPICDVASCDFYYYYPVGTAGTANSPQTYAVVYGYNEVKTLASNENGTAATLQGSGLVWPYAAIRSEAGNTHARGGEFYTYFGEENTYSIYSEGGTMTVGLSGESDPPKFQAIGKGVCINMAGTSGSADQTLTIENGEFSSKIGDTIKMSGGEMEVKKGKFTKDATGADENSTNNGSAISISGGTLNMAGSEKDGAKSVSFTVKGSYVNGIRTEKETTGEVEDDEITNAAFNFNTEAGESGSSNIGISANGGTTIATNCTFTMPGSNNTGIYAQGGTTTATGSEFTLTGNHSYGVHAENGETTVSGCTIDMTGEYVSGIYTAGGTVTVDGGTVEVSFGEGKTYKLLTSTAVSTEGGKIAMAGNVRIASESLGITARSGTITIDETADVRLGRSLTESEGSVEVSENLRATGIYVNNGTITNEGTIDLLCAIDDDWNWVNRDGSAYSDFNKYNGVYVQGGSLVSEGTLNVTHTGVESDKTTGAQAYLNHLIKSYAVRVEAAVSGGKTEVSIAGGTISNSVGGGVLVNGGTVTLGKQETTNGVTTYSGPTVQTTGTENYDFNNTDFEGNWNYKVTETGGDAVKVANGNLTIYGGEYTSKQGNGILVQQNETGTSYQAEVYGGTFSGDDVYSSNTGNDSFYTGPGASYAFKVLGGTLTIYEGIFTSNDGGAFVMNGEATMYGGIIAAQGATAFVTYTNATVTFDPTTELTVDGVLPTGRTLYVSGASSGLTVEETSGTAQKITINGGTFTGGTYEFTDAENQAYSVQGSGSSRNGIWYGNGGASLSIAGGTIVGSGLNSNNTSEAYARALYLDSRVYLQAGKIQISGGTFNGGRDAIYVDATGENGSVLITDGTFNGQKDSDGGCALWFEEYHDDSIFQISGGAFSSAGGAINGNTGRGWTEMKTGNIFASEAYCFTTKPTAGTVQSAAIYNRTGWRPYSYYQVGGSGSNASISFGDTVYNSSGNSLGDFNELTKIVVRSDFVQQTWPS